MKNVKYQTHANWDTNNQVYVELENTSEEQINLFLDELMNYKFQYVYDEETSFYSDGKKQAHLYFELTDGTTIELRLFEGGYVGYRELGWYFVQMPGERFDVIFNLCQ